PLEEIWAHETALWLHRNQSLSDDYFLVGVQLSDVAERCLGCKKNVPTPRKAAGHPTVIRVRIYEFLWVTLDVSHLHVLCRDQPDSNFRFRRCFPSIINKSDP